MQAIKQTKKAQATHVIFYETRLYCGPAKSKHVLLLVQLKHNILQQEVIVHKSFG